MFYSCWRRHASPLLVSLEGGVGRLKGVWTRLMGPCSQNLLFRFQLLLFLPPEGFNLKSVLLEWTSVKLALGGKLAVCVMLNGHNGSLDPCLLPGLYFLCISAICPKTAGVTTWIFTIHNTVVIKPFRVSVVPSRFRLKPYRVSYVKGDIFRVIPGHIRWYFTIFIYLYPGILGLFLTVPDQLLVGQEKIQALLGQARSGLAVPGMFH